MVVIKERGKLKNNYRERRGTLLLHVLVDSR
jgi:hypothetical protein